MDAGSLVPDVPEPLQWFEGMALAPQHFQQHDSYWHAVLHHQLSQLEPYYWGLIHLELDERYLSDGEIVVKSLQAVMPNGLIVQFPRNQDEQLKLVVSAEEKSLLVHLAVVAGSVDSKNHNRDRERYDLARSREFDENTGEGEIDVVRRRIQLLLLRGESLSDKHVALPLLKICRKDGKLSLEDFHPPMLRLGASRFLGPLRLEAQCVQLAERIRRKAEELRGALQSVNSLQLEVVKQLVAALPEFELLSNQPSSHPFRCYAALSRLMGHMAGLGADPVPSPLKYVHTDAAPSFMQQIARLNATLDKLSAAYRKKDFQRRSEHLFVCELPADISTEDLIIEARPVDGQSPEAVERWLEQAIIGTKSIMALLRQRRLPARQVKPLSADQLRSLGVQSGSFYSILNQDIEKDDETIQAIQRNAELHIEGPPKAKAPATIVLYMQNQQPLTANGGKDVPTLVPNGARP